MKTESISQLKKKVFSLFTINNIPPTILNSITTDDFDLFLNFM